MDRKNPMSRIVIVAGLIAGASIVTLKCTGTNFSGAGKTKGKGGGAKDGGPANPSNPNDPLNPDTDDDNPPGFDPGKLNDDWNKDDDSADDGTSNDETDTGEPIRVFSDDFKGGIQVKPIEPEQKNFVWAVTSNGNAHFLRIEGDNVVEKKRWTGVVGGGGGSRTYVLEGGSLVVARSGGHLYFIDPEKTAEGDIKAAGGEHYHKLNGPAGDERGCIVSYRKEKKRYVGIGYGNGNFAEFAMDDKPPFKPQWNNQTGDLKGQPATLGSYSCFVDQERLIYYAQSTRMAVGPIYAVDLKKLSITSADSAPNSGFTSTNLQKETTGPKTLAGKGSYAMGGDPQGNVFNGEGYYTFAFEPKSQTVWAPGMSNGNLAIFPRKCLATTKNCTGFATFNTKQENFDVGPISALGDGRMAGMFRGSNSVLLIKLKDPKDLTKGVDATPIAQLDGDPYMYTDFTGATLYLTKSEMTFELDDMLDDKKKPVRGIGFSWAPKKGDSEEWVDIKLEVRCYKSGDDEGSYEKWENVKDALEQTVVLTDSCKDKVYDRVDVRLTQLENSDTLMNVRKVQITAYQ